MTLKPFSKFLIFTITICVFSAAVGCSTVTPIPAATVVATETATATKIPVPSATITSASEPSPTPYSGPNILFYVQDDNRLFSINADGSDPREIAQGILFAISPDKKKLVYRTSETYFSNDDEVVVWDLLQEEVIYRWNIPGYCEGVFRLSEFNWSPDSQKIAFMLGAYDAADALPDCGLQYNYEDMGIYQIDLMSTKIAHPLFTDTSVYDYRYVSYSPDSSKLRLRFGSRGEVFDVTTWEKIPSEPIYDVLQLCDRPEKIGMCDGSDLCFYDHENHISKYLTQYRKSDKYIDTSKLLSDCSAVVYETHDRTLHTISLSNESDRPIATDIWEYTLTPNNNIVFLDVNRDVFIMNNDGSIKNLIAKFTPNGTPIFGASLIVSPTGKQIAFVNTDGIAVVDLDGTNLLQVVSFPDIKPTDRISLKILDWQ